MTINDVLREVSGKTSDTSGHVASYAVRSGGNVVAFQSYDNAFVPDDRNRAFDIFVRRNPDSPVELASARDPMVASTRPLGLTFAGPDSVTADGRMVVFMSDAQDLVANDINPFRDVFVLDKNSGTNLLVSAGTNGFSGTGFSMEPVMSGDGRFVAFTSSADDLVTGDTNRMTDIFVRDLASGATRLVSVSTNGVDSGDRPSRSPAISVDGRYVAFVSRALNLSEGSTFEQDAVFLRDTASARTYFLRGVGSSSLKASAPLVSSDGKTVVFAGGSPGSVFVWKFDATNIIFSAPSSSSSFALSSAARYVAYQTGSVFTVFDLLNQTNALTLPSTKGFSAFRFSGDERSAVFVTAEALTPTDVNLVADVYRADLMSGATELVSWNAAGTGSANRASDQPRLGADGRFIVFRSLATDLIPGVSSGKLNLYLRDMKSGTTTLLSANATGSGEATGASRLPVFGADNRTILFTASAADLSGDEAILVPQSFQFQLPSAITLDTDVDGLDDNWERSYFGNLQHNGLTDSDFDGSSDASEFFAGTSPVDPRSRLGELTIARTASAGLRVSWSAVAGRSYKVQYKNNLNDSTWIDLPHYAAVMGQTGFVDDTDTLVSERYYRVVIVP